ncbi:MAG: PAS domain-containing protein [Chloroflexi bacterium]|nr:PAS domain-containing protein [Chloroflexota bacterium]
MLLTRSIIVALHPIVAGLAVIMAVDLWYGHRRQGKNMIGSLLLLAASHWLFASTFELLSNDLQVKRLWDVVQLLGSSSIPILWLWFASSFTNSGRFLKPPIWILLAAVPVLLIGLAVTNPLHNLVWVDASLVGAGSFSMLQDVIGPALLAFYVYSYALVTTGVMMFVRALLEQGEAISCQTSAVLLGALLPLVISVTDVLGLRPFADVPLTPFAIVLVVPTLALNFYRLRRADLSPLARVKVVEHIAEGVIVIDGIGRITDMNPAAEDIFECQLSQVLGAELTTIWPTARTYLPRLPVETGLVDTLSLGEGERRHTFDLSITTMTHRSQQPVGHIIVLHDTTQRSLIESEMRQSLAEKEMLLKEIHHRVKNNLQVVSSLLRLQARSHNSQAFKASMAESENRIHAMALIHEQLYGTTSLSQVDFRNYIELLTEHLATSHAIPASLQVEVNAERIYLSIDQAISCGLLINELISNAFKYAFHDGQKGQVYISFRQLEDGQLVLTIEDNGIGLPNDLNFPNTGTLGLQLVDQLVHQLLATLELDRSQGTKYTVTFKSTKS